MSTRRCGGRNFHGSFEELKFYRTDRIVPRAITVNLSALLFSQIPVPKPKSCSCSAESWKKPQDF